MYFVFVVKLDVCGAISHEFFYTVDCEQIKFYLLNEPYQFIGVIDDLKKFQDRCVEFAEGDNK